MEAKINIEYLKTAYSITGKDLFVDYEGCGVNDGLVFTGRIVGFNAGSVKVCVAKYKVIEVPECRIIGLT